MGSRHRSSESFARHLPPWLLHGYGATGPGGHGGHWSGSGPGSDAQKARHWKKFKEQTGKSASIDRGNDPESRYKYSVTSTSAFDSALSELSERVKRASRHVVHPSPFAATYSARQSVASSPAAVALTESDGGRLQRLSVGTDLTAERPAGGGYLPSPDVTDADGHDCATAGCQRVIINVSGQRFETQLRTLARFPDTLLGDPSKRRRYWDARRNEFFLDRHRPTFQAILYYYQSGGRLRRPLEVPEDVFLDEIEFYQLGDDTIGNFRNKEGYAVEKEVLLPDADWQRSLWLFCEEPDSSIAARVFAIVSVACILVSVVSFCMETLPSFDRPVCINVTNPAYLAAFSKYYDLSTAQFPDNVTSSAEHDDLGDNRKYTINHVSGDENSSTSGQTPTSSPSRNSSLSPSSASSTAAFAGTAADATDEYSSPPVTMPTAGQGAAGPSHYLQPNYRDPFFVVESICVTWFTIEFALRLIGCPSKRHFCQSVMNAFDVLAIVPYFVVLVVQQTDGNCETAKKSGSFVFVRVLRVFRIFKLSKHSQGLRILGLTIKTSMHELGMFFFFLAVAMVIFSSAAYYAEAGEPNSKITSIPGAFWWAIVTMTTVGYGDVTPVGVWGKLVGTLCVIAGVLTIALPVPVVVANFNNFYRHEN